MRTHGNALCFLGLCRCPGPWRPLRARATPVKRCCASKSKPKANRGVSLHCVSVAEDQLPYDPSAFTARGGGGGLQRSSQGRSAGPGDGPGGGGGTKARAAGDHWEQVEVKNQRWVILIVLRCCLAQYEVRGPEGVQALNRDSVIAVITSDKIRSTVGG